MDKIKLILIFFLVSMLLGCNKNRSPKSTETEVAKYCIDKDFKQKIEFETPQLRQVTEGIHLTGSIEPNPDKVVNFISLANGIISNVYFSLGDKVTKGQILAELRSTELSSLQAEFKNLESQQKVAEKKLQSVQSMYNDGISSQKELIEAQSDLEILKIQKQKTIANLNIYGAKSEKGVFQIKAPSSGIITSKSITTGSQIISEGEPLFTISDLSEIWVMINIYATNIKDIHDNMEVQIKTLSYPDEIFIGKIASIFQVYDDEAKVLKAKIVLPNKNLRLKPGMLADIEALKIKNIEALSISTKSIIFDDGQNYIIVYKSDCNFEIRKIDILSNNNGITFIANGLKEKERIVSKNQLLIYEQLKNF